MKRKPFIPAWLDDEGLTAAEMRILVHLLRCADNDSGIAWPSYLKMIEITGLSKSTIRRSIAELISRHLIEKLGKPFGDSCRYRVLPIVSPEGQLKASNESTRGTIESPPIVPPEAANSSTRGMPIVSPEGQEGSPKKVPQRRFPKEEERESLPFESEAFRNAWMEWGQHRKEIRKPITPLAAKKALNDLAKMGEAGAVEAINHSIANGYQGIFPPSPSKSAPQASAKPLRKLAWEENARSNHEHIERVTS